MRSLRKTARYANASYCALRSAAYAELLESREAGETRRCGCKERIGEFSWPRRRSFKNGSGRGMPLVASSSTPM